MPEAKQITRPTPYASSDDFRRVFDQDMNSLCLLSYLLTADRQKAEQCFVSGLEDAVEGNPVFKEWARSWARRVIIINAVRAINPRPIEENSRSSSAPVSSNGKTQPVEQVEIAAVLALEPFERFVYVMTVLERYSDHDCSLLLSCARRDVVAVRTRALEQIGSAVASHSKQLPPAGSEKPASDERRSSQLELLVGRRLAISTQIENPVRSIATAARCVICPMIFWSHSLKGAMAGLAFSSPRPGRPVTIPPAWVADAGARICGGTFERIRLRVGRRYRLS
jgi:hypothetical protein